jgi:phosphatidylinositol glycan class K
VQVDYRGCDVTVENFFRLLTGRHHAATPRAKRLLTNAHSNVLVYMTGHGGGDFLKFMDDEELNGHDLADSVEAMHKQKRYKEMLIMIDTCQASTLNEHLYSPSVVTIGSSVRDQSSYSHRTDSGVGVSLTDRFTYATYKYFHEHSRVGL